MSQRVIDIVTPKLGSKFARVLRDALQDQYDVKVYLRTTPKHRRNGSIRPHFTMVGRSLDKIEQLERFTANAISCPLWTRNVHELASLGSKIVFARTLTNSTNGRGIVEFALTGEGPVPAAPLYTAYIPKKAEYRFHVFNEEVIDVQQKKKKRGNERDGNTHIRNLNNGYVYCRDNITIPDGSRDLAINAVKAVGYPYGAVDVIYNERQNKCFVLEVNSRPGLEGTTLNNYVSAIANSLNLN